MMQSLWVKKNDLARTQWRDSVSPELAAGEILLEIEKCFDRQ